MEPDTEMTMTPLTDLPDIGPKYEVLEVIGHGGMGVVLKTRHRTLAQVRAVKLLRSDLGTLRPAVLARFRQEAMIASNLSHPNIIRVFDFDTAPNGAPFIVMEYLQGKSVEDLLQQRKRVSLEQCVSILSSVAEALDTVHRMGVVHRDLKPANLFITEDGPVKILDFGISHIEHSPSRITQEGEVVGTLLYMAPEHLQNQTVTPQSDIFSLGATALEMLTGRQIVETDDVRVLTARMMDPVPLVSADSLDGLAPHAAKALAQALSKNPHERFDLAADFIRALKGENLDKAKTSHFDDAVFERFEAYTGGPASNGPDLETTAPPNPHAREWIVIALLLLCIGVFALLFHPGVRAFLFNRGAVTNFLVMPGQVETHPGAENQRVSQILPRLIASYMDTDPRASTAIFNHVASAYPETAGRRISYLLSGTEGSYTLALTATNFSDPNTTWKLTTEGPSLDAVIESATFRLASETLPKQFPKTDAAMCESADRQACIREISAEKALLSGLFPRVERLLHEAPVPDRNSFVFFVYRFLRCEESVRPSNCRSELTLPASQQKARKALLTALAKDNSSIKDDTAILCSLVENNDPLVRAAAQSVTQGTCGDAIPVCKRMDTLFDRLACLRASESSDHPDTTRQYFEDMVQTDRFHFLPLGGFTGLFAAPFKKEDTARFHQMIARFGDNSAEAAETAFRFFMNENNGTEALIAARRCPLSPFHEGLALMADGWLNAGLAKSAVGLSQVLGSTSTEDDVERIRSVLQPVLITKSKEQATGALDGIGAAPPENTVWKAAVKLIRAVADGDKRVCTAPETNFQPFEMEQRYLCEDYEGLLRDFGGHASKPMGRAGRATAFYLGDALLKSHLNQEAARLFQTIASDPLIRSFYPTAAVTAVARLGEIADRNGDFADALRWYTAYTEAWPGLDLPLETHLAIQRRMDRIKKLKK